MDNLRIGEEVIYMRYPVIDYQSPFHEHEPGKPDILRGVVRGVYDVEFTDFDSTTHYVSYFIQPQKTLLSDDSFLFLPSFLVAKTRIGLSDRLSELIIGTKL